MGKLTYLDRLRDPADITHDERRFSALGLTRDNLLTKMGEAAHDVAGWGAGNEAAVIRFAMAEIVRLRSSPAPDTEGGG